MYVAIKAEKFSRSSNPILYFLVIKMNDVTCKYHDLVIVYSALNAEPRVQDNSQRGAGKANSDKICMHPSIISYIPPPQLYKKKLS